MYSKKIPLIHQYLALGDSYTIGEGVALFQSFPYQLCQQLRKAGISLAAPEIIARTGWTTDELEQQINNSNTLPRYDLVTLLIGVNDQYRGRPADSFRKSFPKLLERAVQFAGGRADRSFVLSIPDWGRSPFARDRDKVEISASIDAYNLIIKEESIRRQVAFIDITTGSRQEVAYAEDGLHPASSEYRRWTELLLPKVRTKLSPI